MTGSTSRSGAARRWVHIAARWLGEQIGLLDDPDDDAPATAREWALLAAARVAAAAVLAAAGRTPWAIVSLVAAVGVAGTAGRRRPHP